MLKNIVPTSILPLQWSIAIYSENHEYNDGKIQRY